MLSAVPWHGDRFVFLKRYRIRAVLLLPVLLVLACASSHRVVSQKTARDPEPVDVQEGLASYYARSLQNQQTASGERYDEGKLTAAHRTLPFGTRVRVTNLANGQTVVVRVNDRGPFVEGRIIDLSYAAAARIDLLQAGVTRVRLDVEH